MSSSSKSTTKDTKDTDEPKGTLPPGHPKAGYVSPDLSFQDGVGKLSEPSQDWADEVADTHEEEKAAVEEHEDKVVKEEQEQREKDAKEAEAKSTKTDTSSGASAASAPKK